MQVVLGLGARIELRMEAGALVLALFGAGCQGAIGAIDDPLDAGPSHAWPSQGNGGKVGDDDGGAIDPGGAPTPPQDDASSEDTDPIAPPAPADDGGAPPVTTDGGATIDAAPPEPDAGPPPPTYPSGPYGFSVGSVFPNVTLSGYVGGSGAWTTISMQGYYDPDGSRHANAIYVDVSASWCAACESEAADLPTLASTDQPRGAAFLSALIEDATSSPATQATVDVWQGTYHLPFDVAADPAEALLPKGSVGLPRHYLIDPRTMQVVDVIDGYDAASTASGLDTLLSKNGG